MWLTLTGGVLVLAGTTLGALSGQSLSVVDDAATIVRLWITTHPWRSRVALALAGIGGALSIVGFLIST